MSGCTYALGPSGAQKYRPTHTLLVPLARCCILLSLKPARGCKPSLSPAQGFAYVEFLDEEGMKRACGLSGQEVHGKHIMVAHSQPPSAGFGGRGGRGGRGAGEGCEALAALQGLAKEGGGSKLLEPCSCSCMLLYVPPRRGL
jgi:hypothetical protein